MSRSIRQSSCRILSLQRTVHNLPPLCIETVPIEEIDCHQFKPTDKASDPISTALIPYYESETPVLLKGAVSDAPAMTKWQSWEYFLRTVDSDSPCHAEIGGNYAKSERSNIQFGDYIAYLQFFQEQYGRSGETDPPAESLVYLAQNDIFPELHEDYEIPQFCSKLGAVSLYSTMIWIGPYGCVSPLHQDPLDNAFMQFIGSKRALLYPPETYLYAGTDGNQSNTSPFDPEATSIDTDRYPLLVEGHNQLPPAIVCTLLPGDLLHIPKQWWHHVRTIETSVSVNTWWR